MARRLEDLIAKLSKFHGAAVRPPFRDPYRLLLWEQLGYLCPDLDRAAAYDLLRTRVGEDPDAILAAADRTLQAIVRRGGAIAVPQRARRLKEVAERIKTKWNGDLKAVLDLPIDQARRELMKFPAIGQPGAERILSLCGAQPVLGLDSNALRVLQRLGYGDENTEWKKAYRESQAAAEAELPDTVPARLKAGLLLRQHGQTICRRTKPACAKCPLLADCPTGRLIVGN
jgi:endonuclease III